VVARSLLSGNGMPVPLRFVPAVLLVAACSAAPASAPVATEPAPALAAADTTEAVPATVPDWLTVTGKIAAHNRSDLVADASGNIVEVLVERGAQVRKGAPLVRIDVRSAAFGANEARANLAALESQRGVADAECARSSSLFERGAITRAEWERDQSACTQAQQSVAAARARVSLAGKSVASGVLRAPFDGVVTERWVSPGEWASPGTRLVTLVADGERRADLRLSESAASRVTLGAVVEVEPIALPDHVVRTTITRLGAEVDPSTRALVAEAALPAGTRVLPGMFVRARIAIAERTLPAVPRSAVIHRGDTWRVFAVAGDALEERVVQLGPELDGGRITIAAGLTAGERVATVADNRAQDGLALR
jgi:membrane fusion protein (multidrug efflux system)